MESMGKAVDSFSSKDENFLIIWHFNAQVSDTSVEDYCDIYSFKGYLRYKTIFCNEVALDV